MPILRSHLLIAILHLAFLSVLSLSPRTAQAQSSFMYEVVAKTGQTGLVSIAPEVSVNDKGVVALIGRIHDNGGTGPLIENIFIGSGSPNSLVNISPKINSSTSQTFSPSIQINNNDLVLVRRVLLQPSPLGPIPFSYLELWNSNIVNSNSILVDGAPAPANLEFDGIRSYPSINNFNEVIFSAFKGSTEYLATILRNGARLKGGFSGEQRRPVLADNATFVQRSGVAPYAINLFNATLLQRASIASSNNGFSLVGRNPAISDDGKIIAFTGESAGISLMDGAELTPGRGIFVAISVGESWIVRRAAGISGNGFLDPGETFEDKNNNGKVDSGEDSGPISNFLLDNRVSVNNAGVVLFKAVGIDGKVTLFTARFDVNSKEADCIMSVIKVGDTVSGLAGSIQDLEIYDSINNNSDAQIAFWAGLGGENSAVVRAISTPTAYEILAGYGENPNLSGAELAQAKSDCSVKAEAVLGKVFFVQIRKKDGNGNPIPLPAAFKLESPLISPTLKDTKRVLFPSNVVLMFNQNSEGKESNNIRYFQAVHTGSVTLQIKPIDLSLPQQTVKLKVKIPEALGEQFNLFDELLSNTAHQYGVPPEWFKGLAAHESDKFKLDAYRYEPFGNDVGDFRITRDGLRNVAPFNLYTLTSDDGRVGDGIGLGNDPYNSPSVIPRGIYRVCTNRIEGEPARSVNCPDNPSQRRNVTSADKKVSAYELYHLNSRERWFEELRGNTNLQAQVGMPCPCEKRSPSDPTYCGPSRPPDPQAKYCTPMNADELLFTAQTPIAASYGLFQMMYATAVTGPVNWKGEGDNMDKSPHLLFDPLISAPLAAKKLTHRFIRKVERAPSYNNAEEFKQDFISYALGGYNNAPGYPGLVAPKLSLFPAKPSKFFPGN